MTFYKRQPVLVRDYQHVQWLPAILDFIDEDEYVSVAGFRWKYCKPNPDFESVINWVKHDGSSECPVYALCHVMVENEYRYREYDISSNIEWRNVSRYFVIPELVELLILLTV